MKQLALLLFAVGMLTGTMRNAQNQSTLTNYPECAPAQRDPSLSGGECVARMVLHNVQECKELTGAEYRKCAAKVPSKITPPKPPQKTDPNVGTISPTNAAEEAAAKGEDPKRAYDDAHAKALAAAKAGHMELIAPDWRERIKGEIKFQSAMDATGSPGDPDKEIDRINDQLESRKRCLCDLKVGMKTETVLACGSLAGEGGRYPDHINTELLGDDQWVYDGAKEGDAVYVYIDRLGKVANVQCSE